MDESDTILVKRAIRGDRDAFDKLYYMYASRIHLYARLRVKDPIEAEDVTAIVFMNAWGAIAGFSPKHDGAFAPWLFAIAKNAVADCFRKARDDESLDGLDVTPMDDKTSNPEDVLESRLTIQELQQAMSTLTDDQRDVVHLRYIEGFSPREIATIMRKQPGTIRGLQFRALAALRRALSRVSEGDTLD